MTTTIEYALLAGASYYDTRDGINRLPVPQNWSVISRIPSDGSSGFEAAAFQHGAEIVISYAGTYDKDHFGDYLADAGLVAGSGSAQLLQAAEYYLQVKAANPGATITLTGHSLGGGLAALIGVFFGASATTFDQAPFAQTALFGATDLKALLLAKLDANGDRIYSDAVLAPLTDYIDQKAVFGVPATFIPNEGLVSNIVVQGEMLSVWPGNIPNRIGTTIEAISNTAIGATAGDLHSQALLTAFLQSRQTAASGQALNEVTVKLPDLLKMIFDRKLFAHRTDEANDAEHKNLIDHLVRHEAGVQGSFAADAMLARFTSDLWKLAQDGGLTLTDPILSQALMAFAMQFYYENSANATNQAKQLFGDVTGGIQLDLADVSTKFASAFQGSDRLDLKDAKGFEPYFQNYLLQSTFTAAERELIQSVLPHLRDWYVQAGASGLATTDILSRGAFTLGGVGSDALAGGDVADLLVGNAGDDVLMGGKGNDTLLGGTGNDSYVFQTGDGLDTILDSDGQGSILVDGATLTGGAQYGDARVHRDSDGYLYVDAGSGRLLIDGNIVIEDQQAGNDTKYVKSFEREAA